MKINFNQLGHILISILFGLSLIIGALLLRYESERYKRQELEHVQQTLDGLQGSLKSRLYANIHKVSAVKALLNKTNY